MSDLVHSLEWELRNLREDNAKLREALRREQEYHRERSYPEPFKVGTILGRAGDFSYALQILHVWHNWPTVDVEVALPLPSPPAGGEGKS